MVAGMDNEKILKAIDLIIKDVDKKYDECLVDRFVETLYAREVKGHLWIFDYKFILDRLMYYTDHEAFCMLNQARAFKIFRAMIGDRGLSQGEFRRLVPYMNSIWKSLDSILVNENHAALTVLFTFLEPMGASRLGFSWLMTTPIDPPVKILNRGVENVISDLVSLIRYFMKHCSNYQCIDKLAKLFEGIIVNSIIREFPADHSYIVTLKELIIDLLNDGRPLMTHILVTIFRCLPRSGTEKNFFYEQYGIVSVVNRVFLEMVERPGPQVNNITRCVAMTNNSRTFNSLLDRLKSKSKLEAIIHYMYHSQFKDNEFNQLFMIYMLYPLLSQCTCDEAHVLTKKLLATRDECDLIERNNSPKVMMLALSRLAKLLEIKSKQIRLQEVPVDLTQRNLIMILNVLLVFIKDNHSSPTRFKFLLECSDSIQRLMSIQSVSEEPVIYETLSKMMEILEEIDPVNDYTRAVISGLIKGMRAAYHKYSRFTLTNLQDKVNSVMLRIIKLTSRFDDHDVMNEFAIFYRVNEFMPETHTGEAKDSFISLVLEHFYQKSKDTDHRDLLGNISHLLIQVDLGFSAARLKKFGIRPHHEVPMILGDILLERSAISTTVERTIDSICLSNLHDSDGRQKCYVARLDSPNLPSSVRPSLDRLTAGLIATVRGDVLDLVQSTSITLIAYLVDEIVTNNDDTNVILARLSKTGILDLLYDVCTSTMYATLTFDIAKKIISELKSKILRGFSSDSLLEVLVINASFSDEVEFVKFATKAKAISVLLTSPIPDTRRAEEYLTSVADKTQASSLLEDILNFEQRSDGITDCY